MSDASAAKKRTQKPRVEFSQEIFDRICALIADGKSVRKACAGRGMPARQTFNEWRKLTPQLQHQYDQAFLDYEESTLDDIKYIADTEKDPRRAAVMIDARKWDLKIRNRKRFGDHVRNEHTGDGGGPIKSELTLDVSQLSEEQLRALSTIRVDE
ncbi:hypothetical protein [Paraburkholderia caribensis]|uniref:terminase small subunit-like protein n=1 Tax=Paraburkholderia caribensis TaxID=75105 RepID=UPI001CB63EEB|nr:hypothetical protein [Paraburkholderia caribensis]CAG9255955.1 conserved hypothetical protein [Paraburkholderia caribensis]